MQVGFHEPREGFEVDEVDGRSCGRVGEESLDTTAFLAVAGESARGIKEWPRNVVEGLRTHM